MKELKVTAVGFLKADRADHHTTRYPASDSQSYFRRGQLFHLLVRCNRAYDPLVHTVRLEFYMAGDGDEETLAAISVRSAADRSSTWPPAPDAWGARHLNKERDALLEAEVISPSSLPVGLWRLRVRIQLIQAPSLYSSVYDYAGNIYFLFNPWNNNDTTYFKNSELLEDYVLGDYAKIYNSQETGRDWAFGQFEECVIPAFEMALAKDDKTEWIPYKSRGDPVLLSRAISRVVNANDGGILAGAWFESWKNDKDAKAPFYWMGSAAILQQYLDTKLPVKYGQCWVFAGVAATVCRALGLPARCVSNLGSGHDSNTSLTIDMYYDEDLTLSTKLDSEMVWNFHCWTDVWMRRPDLNSSEYDGWQAIDATPQEPSGRYYQCGPAPVKAVLQGDTHVGHDVPFLFTEVNGDRVRWVVRRDGSKRLIDIDENYVGKAVLTKEPLSDSGVSNITKEYKYPEGTTAEKRVRIVAAHNLVDTYDEALKIRKQMDSEEKLNDVQFKSLQPRGFNFGEDFEVKLLVSNLSKETRTVMVKLIVESIDNNGKELIVVKADKEIEVVLEPQVVDCRRSMNVSIEEYAQHIQENTYLRFSPKCRVLETNQFWLSNEYAINVYTPYLKMKIDDELTTEDTPEVTFSLDRILNIALTDCVLSVGGSALHSNASVSQVVEDVPAASKLSVTVKLPKLRAGRNKIFAKFTSAEIPQAEGWMEVDVAKGRRATSPIVKALRRLSTR